jgi:uncharacterized protein YeaO (DUF488 family)
MLKTKSIQQPIEKADGFRICVMRRPGKFADTDFDMWLPLLSPSHQLLNGYIAKEVSWSQYEERYFSEVLQKQPEALETIIFLAKEHTVTLLCWEESPEKCHRRLLAEHLKKLEPTLDVVIQ